MENINFEKAKMKAKELEQWGFKEKLDNSVKLNFDREFRFNNFRVIVDTKFKLYEIQVWTNTN